MAHAIIEYSANLEPELDLQGLVETVHQAALDTGVFPPGGMRTRAARRDNYRIADGHADNGFVHVMIRIGYGRDPETKRSAGEAVFTAVCGHLKKLFEARPLGISLEMQEIDPDLSFKKNNLHDYVKRRQAA